jgi:hypothetical protein
MKCLKYSRTSEDDISIPTPSRYTFLLEKLIVICLFKNSPPATDHEGCKYATF